MTESPATLDMTKLLATVPIANQSVQAKRHGKTLILYVPIRKRWWMQPPLSWLPGVQFRDRKGFALDRLGEEVWQACDGRRTTEQIVEQFAARHKVRFHEARLSVMTFLSMLMQRNVIALAGVDQGDGGRGPVRGAGEEDDGR